MEKSKVILYLSCMYCLKLFFFSIFFIYFIYLFIYLFICVSWIDPDLWKSFYISIYRTLVKRKGKKKVNIWLIIFWNACNTTKYFERPMSYQTSTLVPKSFVQKMMLKFLAMSGSFKTNQAFLRTHIES